MILPDQHISIKSYKHRAAKQILSEWLDYDTELERKFYIDDKIVFVPDITCTENNIVVAFYEVCHKHTINGRKLGMIQSWCYRNRVDVPVYEVDADWVLSQIEPQKDIKHFNYYFTNTA